MAARIPAQAPVAARPLGLAYLTVPGAHPVVQIDAAADTGFAFVGLRLVAPLRLTLEHDIVANPALRREVAAALASTGVRLYDADALTIAPGHDVSALRPAIDAAADLGATLIQVVVEDPDRARAADQFAALCDLAGARSVEVALEFMRWRAVRTLGDAVALLERADRPNATICFDCLHFVRSGGNAANLAKIGAQRVGYVQLCDGPLADPGDERLLDEARQGRRFPGEGEFPLDAILDALVPDVMLTIEAPRIIDTGRSPYERANLAHAALRAFLARRAVEPPSPA